MPKAFSRALTLAALAVVILQAMALATRYFQPWLDGDYLLPQRFADDVFSGTHPLSGWTLSSSPYLFPDFAFSLIWRAVLGPAPLLPFYLVTSYLALALLTGWALRRVIKAADHPWLLGALLVNGLLAWQGTGDHARWLWWLGTATFHGGAVLLGLAQFACWAGPPENAPSRGRFVLATTLLFLGLASDTLLFTQFVAPLGAALWLTSPSPRRRSPRLRAFGLSLVVAIVLIALLRLGLALAEWWNFPKVVRYAPTPAAITGAAGRMLADLAGPIAAAVPGFFALGLASTVAATALLLRRIARAAAAQGTRLTGKFVIHYMTNLRTAGRLAIEQKQAAWFAVLGLVSTVSLPVLAVYWQNPQHGRYLLPCLVIPPWWLLTLLPVAKLRTPFFAGIVTASLLGLTAWRAPQVDFKAWAWPHPTGVAELESLLASAGHTRGLADFWPAHYLNTVNRSGLRLNQLRPDGRVRFWGNNAFQHFDTASSGAPLVAPRYSFILVNDLDPAALREKYGEPVRIAEAGGYVVWLYDDAGAVRLSALVDAEVRDFLDNRPGTERIGQP